MKENYLSKHAWITQHQHWRLGTFLIASGLVQHTRQNMAKHNIGSECDIHIGFNTNEQPNNKSYEQIFQYRINTDGCQKNISSKNDTNIQVFFTRAVEETVDC